MPHKNDSVVRVIVFGDSFAEGIGASYDSTWPRLLEKEWLKNNIRAEVVNAGVGGSDIFYEYVLYRDKLSALEADIVIVSMNCSDYIDFFLRGGMERFGADGKVHTVQQPRFEVLYKHSYLFRALLSKVKHYPFTTIFLTEKEMISKSHESIPVFYSTIREFKNDAQKNKSAFVFIAHANPSEIIWKDTINKAFLKNLNELSVMLKDSDMVSFNISDALLQRFSKDNPATYSHIHDTHYNSTGYAYMAELIADSLIKSGVVSLYQNNLPPN